MKRLLIAIIWGILTVILLHAVDTPHVIQQSEQAYKRGYYHQAEQAYHQLLVEYPNQPELLYNLGNTYYQQREFGRAISCYIHALKQSPRDYATHSNLAQAKDNVIDMIGEQSTFWDTVLTALSYMSTHEWLATWLAAFSIWSGIWVYVSLQKESLALKWVGILAFFFFIVVTFPIGIVMKQEMTPQGVVVMPKASIRGGPSGSDRVSVVLYDGTILTILQVQKEWVEVKLPNSKTGWIHQSDIWIL